MTYKFFLIPIHDSGAAEEELNAFLRSHRVLSIEKRWIEQGINSCWSICVDYLEVRPGGGQTQSKGKARIDYREVLTPEQFSLFARLRELRKQIAQEEAVPVYAVFTNEQLAHIVRSSAKSKAALEKIDAVGEARIEKYGDETHR